MASLKELIVRIGSDVGGAMKGFGEVEDGFFSVNKAGVLAGAGIAGAGAAAQATLDSTKDMRAGLGRTRVSMGLTDKQANALAREISNVTFPLEDVTATMDIFARQGVKTQEEMKELAGAADLIADATGSSAASISKSLAPTLRGIDGDLSGLVESADAFTLASRTTGLSVEEIARTLEKSSTEIKAMGLSTADATGLIALYGQETGKSGRDLRQDFDQAVREADGDLEELSKTLGLGGKAIDKWNAQLAENEGIANKSAAGANETHTVMDKLKHTFSELKFAAGGALAPVDALAPAMMAAGGATTFFSTVNTKALVPATMKATAALWAKAAALWATLWPILAIIAVLALLVAAVFLVIHFWDDIVAFFKRSWEAIKVIFTVAWDKIKDLLQAAWDWILDNMELFLKILLVVATGPLGLLFLFWEEIWEAIKDTASLLWAGIKNLWKDTVKFIIGMAVKLFNLWRDAHKAVFEAGLKLIEKAWEGMKKMWSSVVGWFKGLPDTIKEAFVGLAKSAFGWGKDILQGLWDGVEDHWKKFWGWFTDKFGAIPEWVRKLLGIASPSKVFDAIGEWSMEGLLGGMQHKWRKITGFLARAVQEFEDTSMQMSISDEGFQVDPSRFRPDDFDPDGGGAGGLLRETHFIGDTIIHVKSNDPKGVRRELEEWDEERRGEQGGLRPGG